MKNKLLHILTFLFLLVLSACIEDENKVKCGCNATIKEGKVSTDGIVVKVFDGNFDGYVFLSLEDGYYDVCDTLPAELQVDGLMLEVSGNVKKPCEKSIDPVYYVQHYPFELSTYETPVDSLFKEGPIIITIIKSEDYGYPQGFGYRVESLDGLKILQPTIPGVGGLKTFPTPTEAFKVAVLVGHKILASSNAFPTVTLEDLYYLQVL